MVRVASLLSLCWTQLVAMLFSQLARADSLTEICNGLARCLGKLMHLGIHITPPRPTLSYANCHRPALFEELFWKTMRRFRSRGILPELVFKALKAKPQDQDLCWHHPERPPHSDLESSTGSAHPEMAALPLPRQLVPLQCHAPT